MAAYCLVENGIVKNIIEWDGVSEYTPPDGSQPVPISDGAEIGSTWDGVKFTPPAAPDPAPSTSGPTVL